MPGQSWLAFLFGAGRSWEYGPSSSTELLLWKLLTIKWLLSFMPGSILM